MVSLIVITIIVAVNAIVAGYVPFGADAFTIPTKTTTSWQRREPFLLLSASSADDSTGSTDGEDSYDQWYADFDPSDFVEKDEKSSYSFNRDSRSSSSNWGGGGDRRGGGRQNGSGNNRMIYSGSEYTRDTSRDQSNVDEGAVYGLLEDRIRAKKRRDFDEADAIRDQLLSEYSVAVFDRDRTWRTGASASGSGMRGGGGGAYGRGGQGRGRRDNFGGGGGGDNYRRGRGRGPRRDRDWGPNGHDYFLSPDAGPNNSGLSESEIHSIIAERLQAKLSRNYDTADRLQRELVEMGIYVHDGMKEWRADAVPYGDIRGDGGRPGRTQGSWSDRNRPYAKSPYSDDVEGDATDEEISELMEARSMCKMNKDYMKADEIRDTLLETYNVHIDDRVREWSVGGNFGRMYNEQRQLSQAMKNRGYVKSENSAELSSPADEEYIQGKIDERAEAKKSRDFDTADDIRDELLAQFDVTIDDKLKKWSIGGDFGDDGPKRPKQYTRRGGGNLSEEDVSAIQDMIKERFQAKKNRDFNVADEIRDHLRETYQVTIDDRSKEWRVDSDDYVQSQIGKGSRVLSEDEIELVQSKVAERAACRRERDYEGADEIRDELLNSFSVMVDDRTKEWSTVAVDGGEEFAGDEFAAGSMKSQQSAFKNTQETTEDQQADVDEEFDSIFDADNSGDDSESDDLGLLEDGGEISSSSEDDLSALTVVQLKDRLRDAGKPVSGKKAELIERLLE